MRTGCEGMNPNFQLIRGILFTLTSKQRATGWLTRAPRIAFILTTLLVSYRGIGKDRRAGNPANCSIFAEKNSIQNKQEEVPVERPENMGVENRPNSMLGTDTDQHFTGVTLQDLRFKSY